jgi:hypothetical protein
MIGIYLYQLLCTFNSSIIMRKLTNTLFFSLLVAIGFGQSVRKTSLYLSWEYDKTIYDRTLRNNPGGMGPSFQFLFQAKDRIKPIVDGSVIAFLGGNKVLYLNPDGTAVDDMDIMVNFFGGLSFHAKKNVYLSLTGGPSFSNGRTLAGIKPSFGFYFSPKKKWTGQISYLNIFNRDKYSGKDFGSINFSLGIKLF